MNYCGKINWIYNSVTAQKYDTPLKVLQQLHTLAVHTPDPIYSIREWIDDNTSELTQYLPLLDIEKFKQDVQYSVEDQSGEETSSPESDQDKALLSEEDKERENLSKILNSNLNTALIDIFGGDESLKSQLKKLFRQDIITALIYTKIGGKYLLVDSEYKLNTSLFNYRAKQYSIILNYIAFKDPSFKLYDENGNAVESIFDKNGILIYSAFNQLMTKFEELLSKRGPLFNDLLNNGYLLIIKNNSQHEDALLLDATYAYFHCKYFDSLLQSELNDVIKLYSKSSFDVENGNNTIETEQNGDSYIVPYIKYYFGKDRSTVVKSWNIGEFRDAIKEMPKLSRLLLETMKVKDRNGLIITDLLSVAELYTVMDKLRRFIYSDGIDSFKTSLKDLYEKSRVNANKYTPLLLLRIHKMTVDEQTRYSDHSSTFNVLNSIYVQFFDTITSTNTTSVKRIEDSEFLRNTIKKALPLFFIQDVVINALNQMSAASYLRTEITIDGIKTDIIPMRDRERREKFNYFVDVESSLSNSPKEYINSVISSYNLSLPDSYTLNFEINGVKYEALAWDSKRTIRLPIFGQAVAIDIYKVLTDQELLLVNDFFNNHQELQGKDIHSIQVLLIVREENPVLYNILKPFTALSLGTINSKKILNPNNSELLETRNILQFLENFLLLDILTPEGIQTLNFAISRTYGLTLNALIKTAIRKAAQYKLIYDLKTYNENHKDEQVTLDEFMLQSGHSIYNSIKNDITNTNNNGKLTFKANLSDDWIDGYFEAKSILDGTDLASTTTDGQRKKLANFRPINVVSKYKELLHTIKQLGNSAAAINSIFVNDPNLITSMTYDKEITTYEKTYLVLKNSISLLFVKAIEYNFFSSFLTKNEFQITPTVYADKTAFATFGVKANADIYINGKVYNFATSSSEDLEELYLYTTLSFYKKSAESIINKYLALFYYISTLQDIPNNIFAEYKDTLYNLNQLTTDDLIVFILYLLGLIDSKQLESFIERYNTDLSNLQDNIPNDFLLKKNLEISLNAHYIKTKNGKLSLNEMVVGYNLFGNTRKRLTTEKVNFIKLLLKYNIIFDISDDSILRKVVNSRKFNIGLTPDEFYNDWTIQHAAGYKSKPYKLIFAKKAIVDNNGDIIGYQNIFSENEIKDNDIIIINPLLEKYFYVYNVASTNITMPLFGYSIGDDEKTANINMEAEFNPASNNSNGVRKTNNEINVLQQLSVDALLRYQQMSLSDLIIQYYSLLSATADPYGFTDEEDFISQYLTLNPDATQKELDLAVKLYHNTEEKNRLEREKNLPLINVLEDKILRLLSLSIASRESAYFKRNMALTATMTPFEINSLTGVGRYTKIAVGEDVTAYMYNPNGDAAKEDAHDGSAFRSPHLADLENGSLADNATGYEVAKTVGFFLDHETGVFTLAKWATPTLTNGYMLLGTTSEHNPYLLYKKMHDVRWNGLWNLIYTHDIGKLQTPKGTQNTALNFTNEILNNRLIKNNSLLYKIGKDIYKIDDLIYDDATGIYFTKESKIGKKNEIILTAQLFDDDQNAYKVRKTFLQNPSEDDINAFIQECYKIKTDNLLHTIDSLYELHLAMGGLNSVEQDENKQYVVSENSLHAVTAFMNAVTIQKAETNPTLNLEDFFLPLKLQLIGYYANKSSIKKYLRNVNSSSKLTDNRPLIYFNADNLFFGTAQDPDHEADEATVREMSQVIASLDAGGQTHDLARQAYQDLRSLALTGILEYINLLSKIISESTETTSSQQEISSKIYHLIVNDVLRNSVTSNKIDLSTIIIQKVKETFGKQVSTKHGERTPEGEVEYLLPISDPNVFQSVITSIASTISRLALERQYSGGGDVLIPGYKKTQIYHFISDDEELDLTYSDVLNLAYKDTGKIRVVSNKEGLTFTYLNKPIAKLQASTLTGIDTLSQKDQLLVILALHNNLNYQDSFTIDGDESDLLYVNSILVRLGYQKSNNQYIKSITRENEIDKLLVEAYLNTEQQKELYYHRTADWFQPSDVVDILYTDENYNTVVLDTIDLDLREIYFDFIHYFDNAEYKNKVKAMYDAYRQQQEQNGLTAISYNDYVRYNIQEIARSLGVLSKNGTYYKYLAQSLFDGISYRENIILPKDLRPLRITFITEDGKRHNIYQLDAVKNAHYAEIDGNTHYKINPSAVRDNKEILRLIDSVVNDNLAMINGKLMKIIDGSVDIVAAEAIVSNNYKTTFGLGNSSLYECMHNFKPLPIKKLSFNSADIILRSEKQQYGVILSEPSDSLKEKWKPIHVNEMISEKDGLYIIYKTSKENAEDYEIGRLIAEYNYSYVDGVYYDENGNAVQDDSDLLFINGLIYRKVYTVQQYSAVNNGLTRSYIYFDKQKIRSYISKDVNGYIANILNSIIESKKLNTILLNGQFNLNNINNVYLILNLLRTDDSRNYIRTYNIDLTLNFLDKLREKQQDGIIGLFEKDGEIYNYSSVLESINKEKAKIAKLHFNLSRFILAARIPSQSLQSYMLMKAVAYMPTSKNLIIVSHFLTWLLGSDYDIDKAYIMGYAFTNNGEFYDWSPLFDWSSAETAQASLLLLTPKNRIISPTANGGLNVDSYINNIINLRSKISLLSAKQEDKDHYLEPYKEIHNDVIRIKANNTGNVDISIDYVYDSGKRIFIIKSFNNLDLASTEDLDSLFFNLQLSLGNNAKIKLDELVKNINLEKYLKLKTFGFIITGTSWVNDNGTYINTPIYKNNISKSVNSLKANIINLLTKILHEIDKRNISAIHTNGTKEFEYEIGLIKKHEEFKIHSNDLENTYKNAIASRILLIISAPINMQLAYSPVDLGDIREGAKYSSLANVSKGLTTMNPATLVIMLQLNMEGKDDIGIFAVGERIFMGLTYYFNEFFATRQGDPRLKLFIHTSSRVEGRHNKNPHITPRSIISDTNFAHADTEYLSTYLLVDKILEQLNDKLLGLVSLEDIAKFIRTLAPYSLADLVISLLLSAATDNAKELILTCINAGSDFAKMYIHLVILGYDIKDIISFMTSPTVLLITDLFREKTFNSNDPRLYRLINKLQSGVPISLNLVTLLKQKLDLNLLLQGVKENDYTKVLYKYLIHHINNELIYNTIVELLNSLMLSIRDIDTLLEILHIGFRASEIPITEFEQDIEEFDKIYHESEETSSIGNWLGLVRKVQPVYSDFVSVINEIEDTVNSLFSYLKIPYITIENNQQKTLMLDGIMVNITDFDLNKYKDSLQIEKLTKLKSLLQSEKNVTEKAKGTLDYIEDKRNGLYKSDEIHDILILAIVNNLVVWNEQDKKFEINFEYNKFVYNPQYTATAINFYNLFKKNFNILDVVYSIPLYNAGLVAWNTTQSLINYSSIKGIIVNKIAQEVSKDFYKPNSSAISKLEDYADELCIFNFIKENNFSFFAPKGSEMYDDNLDSITLDHDDIITIKNPIDIKKFKKWFENYFIPSCKTGHINMGTYTASINPKNEFIANLQRAIDGKLNIIQSKMSIDDVNGNTRLTVRYQQIQKAFRELDKDVPETEKMKLTDYIMLYNFIVSRNKPGHNRLTALFSKQFYYGDTIIDKYYLYLAKLELQIKQLISDDNALTRFLVDTLSFDYMDALIRMAPEYSYRAKNHDGSKFIHEKQRDKSYILKVRQGVGRQANYKEADDLTGFKYFSRNNAENTNRRFNFASDGFIYYFPFGMSKSLLLSKLNDSKRDENSLLSAYRELMSRTIVKIEINC